MSQGASSERTPSDASRTLEASAFRRWIVVLLVIAFVLVIDRVTKQYVVDHLHHGESVQPIPALYPYFQITFTENRGAAFGFLPQSGDMFLIIAILVVAAMLIFYPRLPEGAWGSRIATGMICGGALGNAIDRLMYGAVVDFIHYQLPGVVSNVSNIADHAILAGVVLLLVESWRMDVRMKRSEHATETE
ncbi:MAG: signal peptidase II [Anaerolineae bacterium]